MHRRRVSRRGAGTAFERRLQLPDRRMAAAGVSRRAARWRGFRSGAHHLQPAIPPLRHCAIVGDGCAGPPKPSICSDHSRHSQRPPRGSHSGPVRARAVRDPRAPDAIAKDPLSVAASHPTIIGRDCRLAQPPPAIAAWNDRTPHRCVTARRAMKGTARLRALRSSEPGCHLPASLISRSSSQCVRRSSSFGRSIRHPHGDLAALLRARSSIRMALSMSPLAFDAGRGHSGQFGTGFDIPPAAVVAWSNGAWRSLPKLYDVPHRPVCRSLRRAR